jgi:hypothetical protein
MSTIESKKILINQADNYSSNFNIVLRSSAIFWVKNNNKLKTIISIFNYWKYKNNIKVGIILNLRRLDGELIGRKNILFEQSDVYNYIPPNNFEGSVEIEAFSTENMRIPYAAVMAVYEAENSISMVHSYSRAYSQHEIEDQRTITIGEESCWTLRDSIKIKSFCAIHNGPHKQDSQTVKLVVRNYLGQEQRVEIPLIAMAPFETTVFEPSAHFKNLVEWLGDQPGNARLSFKLNGGFVRMLCGNKRNDETEIQVTHSNFDYSTHETDKITTGSLRAYMRTPDINGEFKQEIVVYPDTDQGEYISYVNMMERKFSTGEIHRINFDAGVGQMIEFSRTDEVLPTRIVTALRLNSIKASIPAECSLGVIHHRRPKKHFHWLVASMKFKSDISWVDFREVYGGCPDEADFVFKLYRVDSVEPIIKKFIKRDLPTNNNLALSDVFDLTLLSDDYCYVTIWCSYGGLMFFSTMKKNSSITIEHSF